MFEICRVIFGLLRFPSRSLASPVPYPRPVGRYRRCSVVVAWTETFCCVCVVLRYPMELDGYQAKELTANVKTPGVLVFKGSSACNSVCVFENFPSDSFKVGGGHEIIGQTITPPKNSLEEILGRLQTMKCQKNLRRVQVYFRVQKSSLFRSRER